MAELFKSKLAILRYGPEARDACWSALDDAMKRSEKLHTKTKSNSYELSNVALLRDVDADSAAEPKCPLDFASTPRSPPPPPSFSSASLWPQSRDSVELTKSPDRQSTKSDGWTITYRPRGKRPLDDGGVNNNNENESKNETAEMSVGQQRPVECSIADHDVLSADPKIYLTPLETVRRENVPVAETSPGVDGFLDRDGETTIIADRPSVGDALRHGDAEDKQRLSEYELMVKEVDENIVLYSKSFLSVVAFIVLFRFFLF